VIPLSGGRVAQTWVRDVCDMLMPLEAEVESLHPSAAAFLRPQSSSLRDHQHPAGRDRARLFDSERFKRKFVTTLADLRGEPGFRIVGYVLIPQGGTVTYCSGPRTAPTRPRLCSPLVAQGPRSGPAALPATRVLAASQTGQSAFGLAPRRIRFLKTSRPRRQSHRAVEKPQGWRASLALHFSNGSAFCRVALQ
jgi:hypothetical protein